MKKNKKLEALVDKDLSQYRNKEMGEKLLEEHLNNMCNEKDVQIQIKASTKKLKIVISSVACVLIFVLIISVLLINVFKDNNETVVKKHYAYEDIISEQISCDDINSDLEILALNDKYLVNSIKAIDGKTGDLLYYSLIFENEEALVSCQIDIVVNAAFNYISKDTNAIVEIAGNNYNIYEQVEDLGVDGIVHYKIYAQTEVDNIKIYISSYEEWTIGDNSNFKNFINSVFIFK